jgi:hypothetical protein
MKTFYGYDDTGPDLVAEMRKIVLMLRKRVEPILGKKLKA